MITWPVLLLIAIGATVGAFNAGQSSWDFARDAIYLIRIPLIVTATLIIVGRSLSDEDLATAVVLSGIVLSLFYLIEYITAGGLDLSRRALRTEVGRGYIACVFAIVALWYLNGFRPRKPLKRPVMLLTLGLLLAPIVISTSRTLPTALTFFLLAGAWVWLGWRFSILLSLVITLVMLLSIPPVLEVIGVFLSQLNNSTLDRIVSEMTMSDFGSIERINSYFRSYEATMAWNQFQEYSDVAKLIGRGFGERVEIFVTVTLGVTSDTLRNYQSVPITHISGMTALVKFGWIGFVIYFFALVPLSWFGQVNSSRFLAILNHGTILLLAHTMLTFQGLFSTLDILNVSVVIASVTLSMLWRKSEFGLVSTYPKPAALEAARV